MKTGLFSLLLILLLAPMSVTAEQLTAEQIAQQVYHRNVGDDMQLRGTMELISKKGHVRTREIISLRKDNDSTRKQLIRFTAPADIDGTAFLTLETDNSTKTEQHLYLPALKRTRRIVSSQKGRSFVNSDFTYEDMQRHPVNEWTYSLDEDETVAGQSCYVLLSTPKDKTDTQYRQVKSWIEKKHFIPLKTLFWDNKNRLAKSYTVNTFNLINGIATEIDVVMEDLSDKHKTRLLTQQIAYNTGLQDTLFTTQALER